MKTYLMGAALAAAFAMPGVASAANGYLDLSYARSNVEGGSSDANTFTFGGAVNFELTPEIEAQADAHWSRIENGSSVTLDAGAFHLFHRNDNYSYGFVASVEDLSLLGGQVYDLGLEGQYFADRVTFDGSITYADFDTAQEDATRYRVGITAFPIDNFSFGGSAERLELNGGDEIQTYSAEVEYQPSGHQTSFFASYRTSDDTLLTSRDSDTAEIGVRYNFGTGTLFERNHTGASKRAGSTFVSGFY